MMNNTKTAKNIRGFTLLELLVTLSIVGVLIAIAAPNFSNMLQRSKVRSALNEWQSSFYFAQSEAMRLKDRVEFCASSNGSSCSNNFKDGWIVIHRANGVNTILQDVAAQDANNLSITLKVNSNIANVTFAPTGRIADNFKEDTVIFKIGQNKMQLNISSEGRLR